jgi:co-chaperonin GroES (HSP10)
MIQPLQDRVLVEVAPPPTKIGRIAIPDQSNQTGITAPIKALKGTVMAIGPGKWNDEGEFTPTTYKPGDKVWVTSRWNDLPTYSETQRLMQEADILGLRT